MPGVAPVAWALPPCSRLTWSTSVSRLLASPGFQPGGFTPYFVFTFRFRPQSLMAVRALPASPCTARSGSGFGASVQAPLSRGFTLGVHLRQISPTIWIIDPVEHLFRHHGCCLARSFGSPCGGRGGLPDNIHDGPASDSQVTMAGLCRLSSISGSRTNASAFSPSRHGLFLTVSPVLPFCAWFLLQGPGSGTALMRRIRSPSRS